MATDMTLFQRKSLDEICTIPDEFISVYIVEKHIWADEGSLETRKNREAETTTVEDFLIDPVRPLLNDVFRQISAPYDPSRHDQRIGQGYWIQAEFGSGKSHVLSFIGALALGDETAWEIVKRKEKEAGRGKRESLYTHWQEGLKKKNAKGSKGIFVVVKTLVGQGAGTIGIDDSQAQLVEYILDAIQEQYRIENGRPISLYPVEILADRFLRDDLDLYRDKLEKFLSDPRFFDENEQETLDEFLEGLQDETNPGVRQDCGKLLWWFYEDCLKTRPLIQKESEEILKHAVDTLIDDGYEGLLLILDEVSLFMQNRRAQRVEDEKTLVVLSNRLVHNYNLPVWTVCAAQQKIESRMGEKNIIANERLKLFPLLNDEKSYYDIALSRVRTITDPSAPAAYYEDYKKAFTWPESIGRDEFERFFPFYPPSIDVVKAVSYGLTTVRSALYFMHQALKTARKVKSRELITLWNIFDDVVRYEEDPSGTTQGITSIKTRWENEWKAYEAAKRQIDSVAKGEIKRFRARCEKILKTLFLYHVAQLKPDGLSSDEIMNSVMEWKDHEKGQQADKTDNLDHYEILSEKVDLELVQVKKKDRGFIFTPIRAGWDWNDVFTKARTEAEQSKLQQDQAWDFLLRLNGWEVPTSFGSVDLVEGKRSIFSEAAVSGQQKLKVEWRKRQVAGSVYMRDLLDIAKNRPTVPPLDSSANDEDFALYVSSIPCEAELDRLAGNQKDARVLFWTPAALTATEQELLLDLAAYLQIVKNFKDEATKDARGILDQVRGKIRDQIGQLIKIVPDRYGRGRVCATDHTSLSTKMQGSLSNILEPVVATVLDATYRSKDLYFKAAASFSDEEAIKVINGIVSVGEIPKGTKVDKNISAVQNFAADLGIVKPGNEKNLDTSGCKYVGDLYDWIKSKIDGGSPSVPTEAIYKNFMGTGGPGGVNYGLSRRLIDLYLLCLVREGKLRITADERAVPGGVIDYATIAGISFKKQTFHAMRDITLMKAPKGWAVLAPFAAALLGEPSIESIRHDADIQDAIRQAMKTLEEWRPRVAKLDETLSVLFDTIEKDNPIAEQLVAWKSFVETQIEPKDPVAHILNAMDRAFGYRAYQNKQACPEDVDDLKARKAEIESAEKFAERDRDIRTAANYAELIVAEEPLKKDLKPHLKRVRKSMGQLGLLMADPAKLVADLQEPLDKIRETYSTRYIQVFDKVISEMESSRTTVQSAIDGGAAQSLTALNRVKALHEVNLDVLREQVESSLEELLPADLKAHAVRAELKETPFPRDCGNLIAEAGGWLDKAKDVAGQAVEVFRVQVERHAAMLQSTQLRQLLEQGKGDPFVAEILGARNKPALADLLVAELSADPGKVKVLNKYLKKIRVKRVKLSDFDAGMETIGPEDLDKVVAAFRKFLQDQLGEQKSGESTMLTID